MNNFLDPRSLFPSQINAPRSRITQRCRTNKKKEKNSTATRSTRGSKRDKCISRVYVYPMYIRTRLRPHEKRNSPRSITPDTSLRKMPCGTTDGSPMQQCPIRSRRIYIYTYIYMRVKLRSRAEKNRITNASFEAIRSFTGDLTRSLSLFLSCEHNAREQPHPQTRSAFHRLHPEPVYIAVRA